MSSASILYKCIVLYCAVSRSWALNANAINLKTYSPVAAGLPTPDDISSHVSELTRASGKSRSRAFINALQSKHRSTATTALNSVLNGQVITTNIKFGSKSFSAVVDTGSSDTWLAHSNFQCIDPSTSLNVTRSQCAFGPTYDISKSFRAIKNENFNVSYLDGEYLNGYMGHEYVSIADINIKNQEVAIVDEAAWLGDGVSSGLVGLAFPGLTTSFAGTNPLTDNVNFTITYSPIFTSMTKQHLVAPMFSIALGREKTPSMMAFGGVPPVPHSKSFARSPLQILAVNPTEGTPMFTFYTITVGGVSYSVATDAPISYGKWQNPFAANSSFQVSIDSGTTFIQMPTSIAEAVNGLFDPPAVFDDDQGAYVTECTAKVPQFGVQIAQRMFNIDSRDMLLQSDGLDAGKCITGVSDGGDGPYFLGDVFLRNVVAVFDVGASEMRFASRLD